MTFDDALAEQVDWMRKARRENPERGRRIVRAEDDRCVAETFAVDAGAIEHLREWSADHDGEFLLFDDADRLMGWARAGTVTSYGPVEA